MKTTLTPYLRKKRMDMVKSYLRGNILDIGCGNGDLINLLNEDQGYYGIDSNICLIKRLWEKYPEYQFDVKNIEEEHLNLEEKFDTITLIAVVEHLKNPRNLLQQCCHMLSNNGWIIITTPTLIGGKVHKICSKLVLTDKSAARSHFRFYSYEEVEKLLPHGFKIIEYKQFELGMNQIIICKAS